MARVYLETSFVSACVTDRKDAGSVYRREGSLEWWGLQAQRHEVCISGEVILELSNPRYRRREEAIQFVHGLPVLPVNQQVLDLAQVFITERVMPGPLKGDAVHVAISVIASIEYMLSWNVQHLANPNKVLHLERICAREGFTAPLIVTPEQFWEDPDESSK
jgi:hypothetical protein